MLDLSPAPAAVVAWGASLYVLLTAVAVVLVARQAAAAVDRPAEREAPRSRP